MEVFPGYTVKRKRPDKGRYTDRVHFCVTNYIKKTANLGWGEGETGGFNEYRVSAGENEKVPRRMAVMPAKQWHCTLKMVHFMSYAFYHNKRQTNK